MVQALTSLPKCVGCHGTIINPPGFVLEGFDSIGSVQTVDPLGDPVDTTAEVVFTEQDIRTIGTPLELMTALADGQEAQHRYVSQWVTFATGRVDNAAYVCTVEALSTRLSDPGYSILELPHRPHPDGRIPTANRGELKESDHEQDHEPKAVSPRSGWRRRGSAVLELGRGARGQGELLPEDYMPTTLKHLAPFAPKLLMPRGIRAMNEWSFTGTLGQTTDPHTQVCGSYFTCQPVTPDNGKFTAKPTGRSLDHVCAEQVDPTLKPLFIQIGGVRGSNDNTQDVISWDVREEVRAPRRSARQVQGRGRLDPGQQRNRLVPGNVGRQ